MVLRTVTAAVIGGALAGVTISLSAAAVAEPEVPPPFDPVAPGAQPAPVAAAPALPPQPVGPAIPGIGLPLAPQGIGLPPGTVGMDLGTVLGQQAVPSPPGAGPGTPPNLSIFNNLYAPLPQYLEPSAPGEGVQLGVAPGQENANISPLEWFGRFADLYRDGRLRGGILGQMPEGQLGQPLPGVAPPPGTNIPPGLVEYLPTPAVPVPLPPG